MIATRVEEAKAECSVGSPAAGSGTSIDTVMERIKDVSTLPHIALRVLEVARDSRSGAKDLRVIIEGDPALSARVLRCINSAAYALRTNVTSLQQAVTYLGFNQVRNLAITASVSDVFKAKETIGTYRRSELWRHMVSVGICARMTASRLKLPNFEEAFLAGLLHDLGIVLEDQHCHEPFCTMMTQWVEGQALVAAEQKYLGFDHTMIGNRIAEAWRFPESICASIRFHHAPESYRGDHASILHCTVMANWICTFKGIMSVGRKMPKPPTEAMQALGLVKDDVKVLTADLDREIAANRQLFEL